MRYPIKLKVIAHNLRVRETPGFNGKIAGKLPLNEVVEAYGLSEDKKWYRIEGKILKGWSYAKHLEKLPAYPPKDIAQQIMEMAAASAVAAYKWKDRSKAPIGYLKGMALVFGRVYCKLKAQDEIATAMAIANTGNTDKDALAHYQPEFAAAGMKNQTAGADTLRHLFVLLIGLGMRESSGKYCKGRHLNATNTTAETAEAGLFQTSYNANVAHPMLKTLFQQYKNMPDGMATIFAEGVAPCTDVDLENYGTGEGMGFQQLSKQCPAFAVEFTALALRNLCKHWGPINRKDAEILPQCNALLQQVQQLIDTSGVKAM